jgi:hypothetical protein
MNHTKFSLADLLTVLGTMGFGFFCFLSFNFLSMGEIVPSSVSAVIIALILGGLAFGIKLLKRTSRNFKTFIIWEGILLLVFVILAYVAVFPFSHYFAVSDQKAEIQQKISSDITQAEGMFAEYESYSNKRLYNYENRLKSIIEAYERGAIVKEYRDYGFIDGTDNNTQIENKVFTLKAQLYPSNYEEMKLVDSNWLADSKVKIKNWSPTGIVKVINTVEIEITSWKNQLKGYSAFRAQGENANDFDYPPLTFNNTTHYFTERSNPTVFSIGYSLGLYVLLLLSYFITKRHTRYPGLKLIFGTGNVKENEL